MKVTGLTTPLRRYAYFLGDLPSMNGSYLYSETYDYRLQFFMAHYYNTLFQSIAFVYVKILIFYAHIPTENVSRKLLRMLV